MSGGGLGGDRPPRASTARRGFGGDRLPRASTHPARSSITAARARTPASQSASSACSAGECRSGGVADEEHRGRDARREHPGVVPRAGGQHRRPDPGRGEDPGHPVPQALVETHQRGVRLLSHAQRDPVARARSFRGRTDQGDSPRNVASSGARASSQALTAEQTALEPFGSAMTLPNVASEPWSAAASRAASTARA